MADVHGMRGWRYDLGRTGALADVIAPPYDVIDDPLSESLHARNPFNVIRLILDPIRPSDTDADNRYTRTARRLREWCRDGVLTQERDPAIYVYHQVFTWEGSPFTRKGVLCRVRLEKFGQGRIYPHEETLPGPKADRLKLFHATGMNLSPVFGLYPDPANGIAELFEEFVRGSTPLEAADHLGVIHRVWPVTDARLIADAQSRFGALPIFIADGHHRYETGIRHLEDRSSEGKVSGPDDPANFILMTLVGMSDPGLQVMPTHRLVSGLPGLSSDRLRSLLETHFDVQVIGKGPQAGQTTWESIATGGRQDALGLNSVADDTWLLAALRSPASMDAIVTDHSSAWKSLGVAILHRLVLDHCLRGQGEPKCRYVHLVDEVLSAVTAREVDLACLVQSATADHIRQLAGTFEKMPPKSTYFYPKLASGLVFNPIQ